MYGKMQESVLTEIILFMHLTYPGAIPLAFFTSWFPLVSLREWLQSDSCQTRGTFLLPEHPGGLETDDFVILDMAGNTPFLMTCGPSEM